jgi:outer membrane protein TolC
VALLQRGQQREEIRANRRAALNVLGELTGKQFGDSAVVILPELDGRTRQARGALDSVRARPEYAQFARMRDRLRAQADVIGSAEKPRISAFGRAGYGRPGLNLLSDQFDTYWLAGVQVQWAPWNWGTVRREREAVAVQREVVTSDEIAFIKAVRRGVERDFANIDRLDRALVTDDEIVALRERIERETRARYGEGVVTAAEYVDRQTDVLEARVARVSHRIERAQACVRILTTLGLEVQ